MRGLVLLGLLGSGCVTTPFPGIGASVSQMPDNAPAIRFEDAEDVRDFELKVPFDAPAIVTYVRDLSVRGEGQAATLHWTATSCDTWGDEELLIRGDIGVPASSEASETVAFGALAADCADCDASGCIRFETDGPPVRMTWRAVAELGLGVSDEIVVTPVELP